KVTYPLQHKWTLFYDTKPGAPGTPGFNAPASPLCPPTPTTVSSGASWEANLRTIGTYDTVETFLKVFSTLHRPSQLDRNSNYHLFKDGIKPMWEDPSNANGGKWSLTFRIKNPALLDRSWMWLVLGLIGEEMDEDDHVTGAVCSLKPRGDRITLWVRNKDDHETVNRLGKKLLSLLEIENEPGISLEFSFHTSGQPVDQPDRYMSVQ
ncbi:translation initiation factor eIF4e, partial [Testicularia cyperi]